MNSSARTALTLNNATNKAPGNPASATRNHAAGFDTSANQLEVRVRHRRRIATIIAVTGRTAKGSASMADSLTAIPMASTPYTTPAGRCSGWVGRFARATRDRPSSPAGALVLRPESSVTYSGLVMQPR